MIDLKRVTYNSKKELLKTTCIVVIGAFLLNSVYIDLAWGRPRIDLRQTKGDILSGVRIDSPLSPSQPNSLYQVIQFAYVEKWSLRNTRAVEQGAALDEVIKTFEEQQLRIDLNIDQAHKDGRARLLNSRHGRRDKIVAGVHNYLRKNGLGSTVSLFEALQKRAPVEEPGWQKGGLWIVRPVAGQPLPLEHASDKGGIHLADYEGADLKASYAHGIAAYIGLTHDDAQAFEDAFASNQALPEDLTERFQWWARVRERDNLLLTHLSKAEVVHGMDPERDYTKSDIGFPRLIAMLRAFIDYPNDSFPRVGLMSDIHGNLKGLEDGLETLWSQKVEKVIFTGDYIDRGANSIKAYEKVRRLKEEGKAIPLIGNHELMFLLAMMGATKAIVGWLANGGLTVLKESEVGLESLAREVEAKLGERYGENPFDIFYDLIKNERPFMERLASEIRRNPKLCEMAEWMKDNLLLYHINEVGGLAVHAGIFPDNHGMPALEYDNFHGLAALAKIEEDMILAFKKNDREAKVFNFLMDTKKSPLWIRGWEDRISSPEDFVHALGVTFIAAGHTIQDRTKNIDRGRIILFDRGMADRYFGQDAELYLKTGGLHIDSMSPYDAAHGGGMELVLERAEKARMHARKVLESLPKEDADRGAVKISMPDFNLSYFKLFPILTSLKPATPDAAESKEETPQPVYTHQPPPMAAPVQIELNREEQIRALMRRLEDPYEEKVISIIIEDRPSLIRSDSLAKVLPRDYSTLIDIVTKEDPNEVRKKVLISTPIRGGENYMAAFGRVLKETQDVLAGGDDWDKLEALAHRDTTSPVLLLRGLIQLLVDWAQGETNPYYNEYILKPGSSYYNRLLDVAKKLDNKLKVLSGPGDQKGRQEVVNVVNGFIILWIILNERGTTRDITIPLNQNECRGTGQKPPLNYEKRIQDPSPRKQNLNDIIPWFENSEFRKKRFSLLFGKIYENLYSSQAYQTRKTEFSKEPEEVPQKALAILSESLDRNGRSDANMQTISIKDPKLEKGLELARRKREELRQERGLRKRISMNRPRFIPDYANWQTKGIGRFDTLHAAKRAILSSGQDECFAQVLNEPSIMELKTLVKTGSLEVCLINTSEEWFLFKGLRGGVLVPVTDWLVRKHSHPKRIAKEIRKGYDRYMYPAASEEERAREDGRIQYIISNIGLCAFGGELEKPILATWKELGEIDMPIAQLNQYFIQRSITIQNLPSPKLQRILRQRVSSMQNSAI